MTDEKTKLRVDLKIEGELANFVDNYKEKHGFTFKSEAVRNLLLIARNEIERE